MDSKTAAQLIELNHKFYSERGADFSDTRLRLQPGVLQILKRVRPDDTVLDIGCGNGTLALELSRIGHRGRYLGVDQSASLLERARSATYDFHVQFVQADLLEASPPIPSADGSERRQGVPQASRDLLEAASGTDQWSVVAAFAVLHHIPGMDLRHSLLSRVRRWVRDDGIFVHSSWQFTASERLSRRIRPWSTLPEPLDVDQGDYLLDWRRGGLVLRYVHEFTEKELAALAAQGKFHVTETFYSDGADGTSGLYQVWRPA